jgi:predicted  nucleic acid-binding Zn-ribbon protein
MHVCMHDMQLNCSCRFRRIVQERNIARMSERLTIAEEVAALARADAVESAAALSALRADSAAHQEGGSELRAQITTLMKRMHELQSGIDAVKAEAAETSNAVAVAAARDVKLSREQVLGLHHSVFSALWCTVPAH